MTNGKSPREDIDLKDYQDPTNLSPKNLGPGLWLASHKRQIYKAAIIILAIFAGGFLLYSGYGYFYYFVFGREQDKILEQSNTGVDLSAYRAQNTPADLQYSSGEALSSNVGTDFTAKVKNPNDKQYASFDYCFGVADQEACGSDFIFPGEEKDVILVNSPVKAASGSVTFKITKVIWQKIKAGEIPDWNAYATEHLNFSITEPKFVSYSDNVAYLEFTITNNSPYSYLNLPLNITISQLGNIVAVNRYTISDFKSQDVRSIQLSWPEAANLNGTIKVTPDINITDSTVYKPYGSN
jgi:hypothetical protein